MTLRGADWTFPELGAMLVFLQGAIQQWHFAINGALWSMSTEAQFYIVFPLVFAACSRIGPAAALWALAAAIMYRFGVTLLPSADHLAGGINRGTFLMNTLAGRIPDFTLGVVLAGAWVRDRSAVARWARVFVLPALALGVVARLKGPTWIADPALAAMCATIAAFALTHIQLRGGSIPAVFGRMSYSFFLLHVPVIAMTMFVADVMPFGPYQRFAILAGIAFAGTSLLGGALYRFVELPSMSAIKRATGAARHQAAQDERPDLNAAGL
jgi:peptidoglycan/LPS O-acetylase OafA/YrhL